MTSFLTAIPTTPRDRFDPQAEAAVLQRLLSDVDAAYRPFAGIDHPDPGEVVVPHDRGTLATLVIRRLGEEGAVHARGDWWAVTAGQPVAASLCDRVRRRGGPLVYEQPVWGQYATVFAERWMDRATAWNTVPAMDAVHYGVTDRHVFISDRPLLVALAMSGARPEALQLSDAFAAEHMAFTYSVQGLTPFEGAHILPVDSALEVTEGRLRLIARPGGLEAFLEADHTLEEGAEALASALTGAMDRVAEQVGGRPLQLRMSGGRDSRVLLALLRGPDLDVRAVTFGNDSDVDVRLARCMTADAGVRHIVTQPTPQDGADETDRIRRTILESGGTPLSESHTLRYRGANAGRPGEAVMLGQWPLMRGGMARTMRNTPETTRDRLLGLVSALASDDAAAPVRQSLSDWIRDVPARTHLDKQYLFARHFRSGRYLHGHIAQYGGEAMIAYPMADEEVAAVSDVLTMSEKVSERAMFGVLRRIWPEVLAVPLDRSRWPFERHGPDPDWSGDDYEARYEPLPPALADAGQARGRVVEYAPSTMVTLAREILADDAAEWVRPMMRTETWDAVVATAQSGSVVEPALPLVPREFTKFLWRARALQVWHSRSWLAG
ncbi:hypothetical protein [Micrococcus luteus]|uniref:hypothetical protein n=1 Tax=Micrococcus luteus TaxID=1270 RepID=UPI0037CCBC31